MKNRQSHAKAASLHTVSNFSNKSVSTILSIVLFFLLWAITGQPTLIFAQAESPETATNQTVPAEDNQASFSIPKWQTFGINKQTQQDNLLKAKKFRLTNSGGLTWVSATEDTNAVRNKQPVFTTTPAITTTSKPKSPAGYFKFLGSKDFFKESASQPSPNGFVGSNGSRSLVAEISKFVPTFMALKAAQTPEKGEGKAENQPNAAEVKSHLIQNSGKKPSPAISALQFIFHDLGLHSDKGPNSKSIAPKRITYGGLRTHQHSAPPVRHHDGPKGGPKVQEEASMVIYQKPKHEKELKSNIWYSRSTPRPTTAPGTRRPPATALPRAPLIQRGDLGPNDAQGDVTRTMDKPWNVPSLFKVPPPISKKSSVEDTSSKPVFWPTTAKPVFYAVTSKPVYHTITAKPVFQPLPVRSQPVAPTPSMTTTTQLPVVAALQQKWKQPEIFSEQPINHEPFLIPPHLQSHQLHPTIIHYQTAHAMQQQSQWRPSYVTATHQQPPVILAGPGPMLTTSSYYSHPHYQSPYHVPSYQPFQQPAQSRTNTNKKEPFQPYMYVVEISHKEIDETTGKDGLADGYYQDASKQHHQRSNSHGHGSKNNHHGSKSNHGSKGSHQSHGHHGSQHKSQHGAHGNSHGQHNHGSQHSTHQSGGQEDSSKQLVLEIFKKKTEVYIETGFEEMAYDHKKWDKHEKKKALDQGYEHKEMKSEKKDQGHSSGKYKEEKDHKAQSKKKKKGSKEQKHGSSKRNKSGKKKLNESKRSNKKGRKKKRGKADHDSDHSGSSHEPAFVAFNASAIVQALINNGTKVEDLEGSESVQKPVTAYPELAGMAPVPPKGAPIAKAEDLPEAEKMVADAEADVDRYDRLFKKFEAEQFGKSFLKRLFQPVSPPPPPPSKPYNPMQHGFVPGSKSGSKWRLTPDGGKRYSAQGTVLVPESALPTPMCHLCRNASIVNQFENGTEGGHRLGKATVVSDMLMEKKLPRGRRAIGVEEITEIVKRDPGDLFDQEYVDPLQQVKPSKHPSQGHWRLKDKIKSDRGGKVSKAAKSKDKDRPTWHMKTWDDKSNDLDEDGEEEAQKIFDDLGDNDDVDANEGLYKDDGRIRVSGRPNMFAHPDGVRHTDEEELLRLRHPIQNHHDPSSKPFVWPHQRAHGQGRGAKRPSSKQSYSPGKLRNNRHRHKSMPRRRYPHQHPRPAPRIPDHFPNHGHINSMKSPPHFGYSKPTRTPTRRRPATPKHRPHSSRPPSSHHRQRHHGKTAPHWGQSRDRHRSRTPTPTRSRTGSHHRRLSPASYRSRSGQRPPASPFPSFGHFGSASENIHVVHNETMEASASEEHPHQRPFLLAHVYRAPTKVYRLVLTKRTNDEEDEKTATKK